VYFFFCGAYQLFDFMIQVRNAVQALQEFATSSTVMGTRYPYPLPAHSNPNLPDNSLKHCNMVMLPRSSSHPPEMFCSDNSEYVIGSSVNIGIDKETQTDDLTDLFEQFVLQNPHRVLLILGLDPDSVLGGRRVNPLSSAGNVVQASDVTAPANSVVNTRNRPNNSVTSVSVTQPTDWIFQLPTAPSVWHQQHHRFSAGDIDDKFRPISPLPATRSLKFQPFTS
jgi:hypothetical protein